MTCNILGKLMDKKTDLANGPKLHHQQQQPITQSTPNAHQQQQQTTIVNSTNNNSSVSNNNRKSSETVTSSADDGDSDEPPKVTAVPLTNDATKPVSEVAKELALALDEEPEMTSVEPASEVPVVIHVTASGDNVNVDSSNSVAATEAATTTTDESSRESVPELEKPDVGVKKVSFYKKKETCDQFFLT